LGPQEILQAAQTAVSGLGMATVYRNLKALVEAGQLALVQVVGESPRYELASLRHHHHFRCRTCAQVFDVEGCPGNIAPLVPKGFTMEAHEVIIHGRCSNCAKPVPQKGRRKP
jgi:Fur family ferric uptake transcriptional regulator